MPVLAHARTHDQRFRIAAEMFSRFGRHAPGCQWAIGRESCQCGYLDALAQLNSLKPLPSRSGSCPDESKPKA